jgi:predicted permease
MPADLSSALLITAALPVFLIMATGAILRRLAILSPASDSALIGLAVNVTYPCFILQNVVGNQALLKPENVVIPFACGVFFMILGGALSFAAAPAFGLREPTTRRTFALACSIQNYGYLPIPVMSVLFPGGDWMGVLFVYSLGVELVLWTAGVWLMQPSAHGAFRNMLNPVVLSIVAGLLLNLVNWTTFASPAHPASWALSTVQRTTAMLGDCAVPIGLLLVGATLGDLLSRPGWLGDFRAATAGIIMRLAILPLTMIGTMLLLHKASTDFRHVIAIQAAMPAAVFPMIIARRYGGHEATALRVIVATTLLSLVTIPFAVRFALRWLG